MHNNYLKVSGNDSLVRDMTTHAIINNNSVEYENYIARRNTIQSQKQQIDVHTTEINTIKQELSEIKSLILTLIDKGI